MWHNWQTQDNEELTLRCRHPVFVDETSVKNGKTHNVGKLTDKPTQSLTPESGMDRACRGVSGVAFFYYSHSDFSTHFDRVTF
jgi:hypothetical protein